MSVQDESDVIGLRKVGNVVSSTLRLMLSSLRPGITTKDIDQIGEEYFLKRGAKSAPQLTYGFPGATCISVNDEIAHGIPGKRVLRPGDLVNIDVSLELDGFFADTGATVCIPPASGRLQSLCRDSEDILMQTVRGIRAGNKLNRIGKTIQTESTKRGYATILNLAGHGVGRALHEEPHDIVNYYDPSDGRLLSNGLVIAVETFISTGGTIAVSKRDKWTLTTKEKSYVAQFEHTIIVTDREPIVLTA